MLLEPRKEFQRMQSRDMQTMLNMWLGWEARQQ